jgi:hypothetical protein
MHSCWLSLFDECAESLLYLVTETVATGRRHHLTEKTFKPIVSKQPFMLLATPGNLAYLKSYGFKTFDSVIDESYDQITNNKDRWNRALDQIELLAQLDPEEVLAKTADIRLHNYNRLHEFRQEIKTQMLGMVYNKIKEKNDHSIF